MIRKSFTTFGKKCYFILDQVPWIWFYDLPLSIGTIFYPSICIKFSAVLCPSLLMIVLANWGCDRVTSVVIFTAALTINGGVTAGYLGNGLDIAPNFSGTIFGLANTLSSLGGYLSALMVGTITYQNQTYAAWSIIFWILAATYFTGALAFVVFGSGELQQWNNPEFAQTRRTNGERIEHPEEVKPLKKTNASQTWWFSNDYRFFTSCCNRTTLFKSKLSIRIM